MLDDERIKNKPRRSDTVIEFNTCMFPSNFRWYMHIYVPSYTYINIV